MTFEEWYEKRNGPIDGWSDEMHEQEAAFEAGIRHGNAALQSKLTKEKKAKTKWHQKYMKLLNQVRDGMS